MKNIKSEGRWSVVYCCIQAVLNMLGFYLSGDTVCKLMRELNVQVSLCNRHRNGKYSSYHGKITDNKLKQGFNEEQPYRVIHTYVTQVRLAQYLWNESATQKQF